MRSNQKVSMKRASTVLLSLAASLCFACGDPGIDYRPKDWSNVNQYNYIKTFGAIDVEMARVGGLIGNTYLYANMAIHNHANSPAVIERALLKANGLEYAAEPPGAGKSREIVPPNTTRETGLYWRFDKTLAEILKDPVELSLTVKVGDERTEIRIPMVKVFG